MFILVFNSGSSSLKWQLFEATAASDPTPCAHGTVTAFGGQACCTWLSDGQRGEVRGSIVDHHAAAVWVLNWLQDRGLTKGLAAIGHRIVHGGDVFTGPVLIDPAAVAAIESLSALAPLHNPLALQVIHACESFFKPPVPMAAVFDTAFFRDLPDHARRYALPDEWTRNHGIRRYGFHGLAHRWLCQRYHEISGAGIGASRIITLQLGQGCSMTAIRGGVPVETSMGCTPLEGLIMATRCGDIDPGALLHLAGQLGVEPLREALNQRAGLLGISGISADMRELIMLGAQGHAGAKRAIDAFCHRARKYLGAYLAVLGGADAIVFGGGIGEHAPVIRERICAGQEWCGLAVDEAANARAIGKEACISPPSSKMAAYVVPVNEALLIARDAWDCVRRDHPSR
ncbi:MAG: acetate/propionate family kinase [Pseudomonadota bacterium]